MNDKKFVYDLDINDWASLMKSWNEPDYRVKQIWQGLYQKYWPVPEQFTVLPKPLRDRLAENFEFSRLNPTMVLDSTDNETRKTLFTMPDGHAIEAVLMHYQQRHTLCISTQAGCAMGCIFCATGQMGFKRHLSSGEIVEQVIYYARMLAAEKKRVTNVVVMGMGEPFHNYQATMAAIDRLNHPEGMNLGSRRFTISTVGLIPAIRRFMNEGRQVNLAVSLHAAEDGLRATMLPINKKYPLDVLFKTCKDYVVKTRRRITFEYALILEVNDSPEQARALGERLQIFRTNDAMLCHVNVILLNPTQGYTGQATTRERAVIFKEELEHYGIPCTIRVRRGIDIQAGCGQLAVLNRPS
jgi:23S rRNA (adenine2503-C2)-methyltransferase